ncbi:MAG: aldo/keto reductase [Bryobacteraceae bacterium]|nr:aldo/keto reductase [Bryobacteraceae bacterium]
MQQITLKQTDLKVSRAVLGTMTFGGQVDERGSIRILEAAIDAGINFIDTANVYNRGVTEDIVGKGLVGKRKRVILASKVFGRMGDQPDQQGLSRRAIRRAIDESLARLQTDYLDIYYLHQPDWNVPLEESLAAMDELVREGKVRYTASSNYAAWQVAQMQHLAKENGWSPAVITQPMYNLLARGIEQEYMAMAKQYGISTVVYNPLAGGLLTGKHARETQTPGTRFDNNRMYQDRYWHNQMFDAVETLKNAAAAEGRSLISLALNWMLHHTAADCMILGATRLEQLQQNLAAMAEGPLSESLLAVCDETWRGLRGTIPNYNR